MKFKRWLALLLVLLTAAAMLLTSCIKVVINTDGNSNDTETKAPETNPETIENLETPERKDEIAKWGVILGIDGAENFGTQFESEDESCIEAGGEYAVESFTGDKVVAPGTSSELLDITLTASVKGTPEVAARYSIEGTVEDIVLAAGTYTDYTNLVVENGEYGYFDTFTLEDDYYPVKWNLVIETNGKAFNVADELYNALPSNLLEATESFGLTKGRCSFFSVIETLKKVAGNDGYKNIVDTALGNIVSGGRNFQLDVTDDGFVMSYDFDPNKVMDFTFELSWEWAFEQKDDTGAVIDLYDMANTYLGNWAAVELGDTIEGFVAPDNGSNYTIGSTFTVTATPLT